MHADPYLHARMDAVQPDLDDVDRHLLSLLQANARESAASLARKLRLARTTVLSRIQRLERRGIVAGYGLRLGQRMEEAALRTYCGLKVLPRSGAAVMTALERFHEVQEVAAVSGEFDYMVILKCRTTQRLDELLDQIGQVEGVQETHTSVVLSVKLDRRSQLPGTQAWAGTPAGSRPA